MTSTWTLAFAERQPPFFTLLRITSPLFLHYFQFHFSWRPVNRRWCFFLFYFYFISSDSRFLSFSLRAALGGGLRCPLRPLALCFGTCVVIAPLYTVLDILASFRCLDSLLLAYSSFWCFLVAICAYGLSYVPCVLTLQRLCASPSLHLRMRSNYVTMASPIHVFSIYLSAHI